MAPSMLPLLLFLLHLHPTTSTLHQTTTLFRSQLLSQPQPQPPPPPYDTPITTYFEVTKPIPIPQTTPISYLALQHDFAYTYSKPPVLANYTPPISTTTPPPKFSKIILEWNATSRGRQFDRIFGVWLGGVELLRSCTAEPRATGIFWTVKKDITRYYSLLTKNSTLAIYLGNLVDSTYTGIYHVNVSFYYYPAEENSKFYENLGDLGDLGADLIIPISRNLPLNDGLWFEIENSTDIEVKEFKIPQNAYKAVLEVYVSFHEKDEFWYSNLPNDYIKANNLTGTPGNGPFREVLVSVDGEIVGAIWPFTVVFTGGINPLLWRPITAIGSFDLPSYDIEITPFLGNILDGKSHKIGFSVTNALNVWYIDANLHVWLDPKSKKTKGKLLKHNVFPVNVSSKSDFHGLNGTFFNGVQRIISSAGWVKSSHGKISTQSLQEFNYVNLMVMAKNGNLQVVNQTIDFNSSVIAQLPSSTVLSSKSIKHFPIFMYSDFVDRGNGTSVYLTNVSLVYNEDKVSNEGFGFSRKSLRNSQDAQGNMVVKNNLVVSGLGSTQQVYKFDSHDLCYFRNLSALNYTILYDKVRKTCENGMLANFGLGSGKWWPFSTRYLTSDLLDKENGV